MKVTSPFMLRQTPIAINPGGFLILWFYWKLWKYVLLEISIDQAALLLEKKCVVVYWHLNFEDKTLTYYHFIVHTFSG